MPALVLDTNIFVSAALHPRGMSRRTVRVAWRHYDVAFTIETFTELRVTLSRDAFDPLLSNRQRKRFLDEVRGGAAFFRVEGAGPLSRDPRDDAFLHLAAAVDAVALVTGDRDLLVLGEHMGIPILSPSGFLRGERLARRGRGARRR